MKKVGGFAVSGRGCYCKGRRLSRNPSPPAGDEPHFVRVLGEFRRVLKKEAC